jgi:spore coat protein U-like protein
MRRWILLSISLIWCSSTLAAISVTGLGSLDLGTWDPSLGPISSSIDFCVASTSGASGNPRDYDAQLDQVAATTPFELISLGSPSETIATTVGFVDLLASAAETLTPGVATAQDKTGVATCPGSSNAQLRFDVNALDLSQAAAGSYRASFTATFRNNNGGGVATVTFDLDLTIPEMIRISDLNDIALGTFDGLNDLVSSDGICVYRNNVAATYTITASGGSGSFDVDNGIDVIPYQVEYDDSNGFVTLTDSAPTDMANANSSLLDCGGIAVATLRITTLSTDMSNASPGLYTDTLTLTVAPI